MSRITRLAVLDDYQGVVERFAALESVRGRGVHVDVLRDPLRTPGAVVAALHEHDAVIAMRERTVFDADVLRALPRLQLIVTTGMANAAIDLEAARERGITVCGTGGSATAAPELTWALLLAALRQLPTEEGNLRSGDWQRTVGREAAGSALGIVGLGRIGTRIAQYARAFDMEVLAWSPHLTTARAAEAGAEFVPTLAELCDRADIVTLHLRLSESTAELVGEEELRLIGSEGLLVNTARAGLVDTDAMLRGLHAGWLGQAALDVYEREPLPAEDPILSAPRTVLSPHLGYVTTPSYERFYREAVEDVHAFLDDEPVRVLS